MVRSYVLAVTATGRSLELLPEVREVEGVREAHVVAGEYDLMIEADGESTSDVLRNTIERIRDLEGIGDTKTYVSID
ncbi:ArsR family transcriptional regulator [Halobacteriales archaeon QS_8_69_26]|nr:MAG: ArsR family transcriptional regulator [Halobacteriales archaeon QS_8_69_26]